MINVLRHHTFQSGLETGYRQAVAFIILSINIDFIASEWGEVGEQGSECVPWHRHGHIVHVVIICRLELNQVGLNVGGIILPGSPEASWANL